MADFSGALWITHLLEPEPGSRNSTFRALIPLLRFAPPGVERYVFHLGINVLAFGQGKLGPRFQRHAREQTGAVTLVAQRNKSPAPRSDLAASWSKPVPATRLVIELLVGHSCAKLTSLARIRRRRDSPIAPVAGGGGAIRTAPGTDTLESPNFGSQAVTTPSKVTAASRDVASGKEGLLCSSESLARGDEMTLFQQDHVVREPLDLGHVMRDVENWQREMIAQLLDERQDLAFGLPVEGG